MDIKLANHHKYTYDEVLAGKDNGGSFVTYQTIIPLPLFYPIRRLSKVYYIDKDSSKTKYAARYNLFVRIFGWWGLPWGPIYTIRSLKLNNSGGMDVTDDIYLNLDEASYNSGMIHIEKVKTEFVHPSGSELKEFRKVFKILVTQEVIESPPLIGLYIATKEGVEPHYIIAIDEWLDEDLTKQITKAIKKRFTKWLKFELVELKSDFPNKNAFIEQSLKLDSV